MSRAVGLRAMVVVAALALPVASWAGPGGWSLGAEVSGADGRITWAVPGSDFDYRPHFRAGWSAGSTVEIPFGPRWSLVSGLRFIELNEREEVTMTSATTSKGGTSTTTLTGTTQATWNWLAVPVRACFHPARAAPLVLEAGPEVRYLTAASTRGAIDVSATPAPGPSIQRAPAANIFEQAGTLQGSQDVTDRFHRVDLALTAGLGAELPLVGHPAAVHVRYAHGLTDIAKGDFVRRSRAFEVSAGWCW